MFIGKVTGHVVISQKEPTIADAKLVTVEAYVATGPEQSELKGTGRVLVAVDFLGAGRGEYVLVTQGSSARLTERTKSMPVDAIVIGLVDTVQLDGKVMQRADHTLV